MGHVQTRRKAIATTVNPKLWDALGALSLKTRIPASRLLDEAIEDLLLKRGVISRKTKTP